MRLNARLASSSAGPVLGGSAGSSTIYAYPRTGACVTNALFRHGRGPSGRPDDDARPAYRLLLQRRAGGRTGAP